MKPRFSKVIFSVLMCFVILAAFFLPWILSNIRERHILKDTRENRAEMSETTYDPDDTDRLLLIYDQISGKRPITVTEQKNIFTGDQLNYVLSNCIAELDVLDNEGLLPCPNTVAPALDCTCDMSVYANRENGSETVTVWKLAFRLGEFTLQVWMEDESQKIISLSVSTEDPENTRYFDEIEAYFADADALAAKWCSYLGLPGGKIGRRINSFVVNTSGLIYVFSYDDYSAGIYFSGAAFGNS